MIIYATQEGWHSLFDDGRDGLGLTQISSLKVDKGTTMELRIKLLKDRSYIGTLLAERPGSKLQFSVCAKVSSLVNAIDPPVGIYEFERLLAVPSEFQSFYGEQILLFQAKFLGNLRLTGEPRFLLPLHSGSLDEGHKLFTTDGGIRMSNGCLTELLSFLGSEKPALIICEEERSFLAGLFRIKASSKQIIKPTVRQYLSKIGRVDLVTSLGSTVLDDMIFWYWLATGSDALLRERGTQVSAITFTGELDNYRTNPFDDPEDLMTLYDFTIDE